MKKILISISLFLICLPAIADNGALKMAHSLKFYGCDKEIIDSQKVVNKLISEGKGGQFETKVSTLGLNQPASAISIADYIGGNVLFSVITKEHGECGLSRFFVLYRRKPCYLIFKDGNYKVKSVLESNGIIAKASHGAIASFRPFDNGKRCMETAYADK